MLRPKLALKNKLSKILRLHGRITPKMRLYDLRKIFFQFYPLLSADFKMRRRIRKREMARSPV